MPETTHSISGGYRQQANARERIMLRYNNITAVNSTGDREDRMTELNGHLAVTIN